MTPVRGLVLVAVLWLTAALGLLTTALLSTVRTETRSLTVHRTQLVAQAQGDAVILLALHALQQQGRRPERLEVLGPWAFDGESVPVVVRPASGWIDLNRAPDALLEQALVQAAGLPSEAARALVQSLDRAAGRRYDAVAELAGLPGVPYGVYAKVAGVLTVHGSRSGAGQVNPLAAPESVLRVLAGHDPGRLQALLAAQASGAPAPDLSWLDPAWVAVSPSDRLVLEADIGNWRRRWWVDLAGGSGPLPWRVLAQETLGLSDPRPHAN